MQFRHFYIIFCLSCFLGHTAFAKTSETLDADLQDVLDPVALSVPPSNKWQPLRVRQAKTLLSVVSRPVLTQDPKTKALTVRLDISRSGSELVVLTVVNGLFVVDGRGQVYVPIPDRFTIAAAQQVVLLKVVPLSPTMITPLEPTPVGFVGGYHEMLESVFSQADRLLFKDFPAVFNKMEQLNGHWKFKSTPPSKRLQRWLRWVSFTGSDQEPGAAQFSLYFWQYVIWAIFEDYDAQDFASWLRATTSISADYAAGDAAELTVGVVNLFAEDGVNADALGPASFEFYYNQGVRAFRTRSFRRAEIFFLEAIKKDPNQLDAHFNLGLTYYRKMDYESAAAAWLVGTGLKTADATMFYHRGVALMRMEKPLKAAKMFREAIAKDKKHKDAKTWLKTSDPDNVTKPVRKRRWRRRRRR